jgi:hypothetical protein
MGIDTLTLLASVLSSASSSSSDADWVIAGATIFAAVASAVAALAGFCAIRTSLNIASGKVRPAVTVFARISSNRKPVLTILNPSPSTIAITSCGFCFGDHYFALRDCEYSKSISAPGGAVLAEKIIPPKNRILASGNYCSVVLPICLYIDNDASEKNDLLAKLKDGKCFAYCAFSNTIAKSKKPISRDFSYELTTVIVYPYLFHMSKDQAKTFIVV